MSLFTVFGLCVVGVLIVILFAQIRIQFIYNHEEKLVVISYLFLKKSFDLNEHVADVETAIEEQATQWFNSLDESKKPPTKPDVDVTPTPSNKTEKVHKVKTKQTTQKQQVPKQEKQTEESTEKKQSFRETVHFYYGLFLRGKQIVLRLTRRFKITRLNLEVTANVDDPMVNAMIYASLWTTLSSSLLWLQQYVKVIKNCHYDVKSQFSGNNFFIRAECIVALRIVDIIIVALLSISDIKTILRALKQKEEVS